MLPDLRSRVAEALGPDRELDAVLWEASGLVEARRRAWLKLINV
jgi:hypothetical protein